jgi:hypothetical protein
VSALDVRLGLNGAGRTRTLTLQIKSLLCCRYTTTPCEDVRTFESRILLPNHNQLLCKRFLKRRKKSLGVELNHRFRLIRATCFRYTTERFFVSNSNQSGWSESNRLSRVPKTRGRPVPLIPSCAEFIPSGPYGSRTHLPALKGRHPRTDRRTSPFARTLSASGSGGARILVSWFSARC